MIAIWPPRRFILTTENYFKRCFFSTRSTIHFIIGKQVRKERQLRRWDSINLESRRRNPRFSPNLLTSTLSLAWRVSGEEEEKQTIKIVRAIWRVMHTHTRTTRRLITSAQQRKAHRRAQFVRATLGPHSYLWRNVVLDSHRAKLYANFAIGVPTRQPNSKLDI